MPDQLQLRGGTTTEHNSFTGALREVTVDTTKKTLVVHDGSQAGGTPLMRESGGNAASNVQIGTGGVNAFSINSSQDITFTGANANLVFDKSADTLKFPDQVFAVFGTGGDLQVYHDGTHSHIRDVGTGDLRLRSSSIQLMSTSSEAMISAVENSGVQLYFDNAIKLGTLSTGVDITGDLIVDGNGGGTLTLGGSAAHTSQLVIADNAGNANGNLLVKGGDGGLFFTVNSAGNVKFEDSKKALFGAGADLEVFHDGSNSHIADTGTGGLLIKGDSVNIGANSGEFYFRGFENGSSLLRFDNSTKLETAADRITVTGHVAIQDGNLFIKNGFNNANARFRNTGGSNDANLEFLVRSSGTENEALEITATSNIRIPNDGKVLSLGADDDLKFYHDPSPQRGVIQNVTGNLELITGSGTIRLESNDGSELMANFSANGGVVLYQDNNDMFHVTDVGAKIVSHGSNHGLKVFHSNGNEVAYIGHKGSGDEGQLVLREGNTAKIVMDCEHQRLSLGSNSAMQISHNDSTTGTILMADGNSLVLRGADNTSGTPTIQLNPRGNHNGFNVTAHQGVKAYYDNALKFETTSVGISSLDTLISHGEIRPASDDNHALGRSNRRYTTLFASNGSINTSDRNEKNTIVESDLGLDFINMLKPVSYKWNKDDGKTHYGLIAQDIEETILSLGKTVADFGCISKEEDSPMGLSYPQLLSPLIKAVQELSAKIAGLEAA